METTYDMVHNPFSAYFLKFSMISCENNICSLSENSYNCEVYKNSFMDMFSELFLAFFFGKLLKIDMKMLMQNLFIS